MVDLIDIVGWHTKSIVATLKVPITQGTKLLKTSELCHLHTTDITTLSSASPCLNYKNPFLSFYYR